MSNLGKHCLAVNYFWFPGELPEGFVDTAPLSSSDGQIWFWIDLVSLHNALLWPEWFDIPSFSFKFTSFTETGFHLLIPSQFLLGLGLSLSPAYLAPHLIASHPAFLQNNLILWDWTAQKWWGWTFCKGVPVVRGIGRGCVEMFLTLSLNSFSVLSLCLSSPFLSFCD